MDFFQLWCNGFLICMVLLTALWLVSVYFKNASIIDPFWGMGFIVLMLYYLFFAGNFTTRSILLSALVIIWGLRLSIFLFWRNLGHGEDYRYQQFRKDYGADRYWWISFFQVFLLQGVLMSLVAVPLLGTALNSSSGPLTFLDYFAVVVWLIGIAFEAGGDYQLTTFKRNEMNKGKVLDTGFWKYTRHPNYFGDATVWWSFGLFAFVSGSYFTLLGSLLMNILLLKISGVSLLERTLKTTKPQYVEYMKKTNSFFPWFLKK
jgi:steroid 5-alpha reductase family enzyme